MLAWDYVNFLYQRNEKRLEKNLKDTGEEIQYLINHLSTLTFDAI